MFTRFFNAKTCELMDPDGLHPFCLVFKLNADDHPSFKETLCMDKETWNKWFNAMDEELQDLFKSGTFEFVSWDEALKQGKETWAFWKKHHPSGEVC